MPLLIVAIIVPSLGAILYMSLVATTLPPLGMAGIAREIVALLGDDFEQIGTAAIHRVDGILQRRRDIGRLVDAARRDVQPFRHLGIIAADIEAIVAVGRDLHDVALARH